GIFVMFILELIYAGLESLKEYIALHVITCLIPAFLLAGAMVTFISKETIICYLGAAAHKLKSFALASGGSFFLAACSCTVIPVSTGLYYGGAGVGPAFIVLWVAPAVNILAIVYTGALLGSQMVIVRILSALTMAFVVGWVMSFVFRREETQRTGLGFSLNPGGGKIISHKDLILILLVVATLLAPNYLVQKGPYLHKVYVWAIGMIVIGIYAFKVKSWDEIRNWMQETWWFVRIILPLLLAGVFVVGVIGKLLPQQWVEGWLGGTSVQASFLATVIGQIMYFATMTEAPFIHKMLGLGMGKGPALALLLTGPGMSLPNILAIIRVFGIKKGLFYVMLICVLGTSVGWFTGNFIFS
ncbi:MAG: permease, partial [Thermodesulfobacteriota bacterium]